MVATGLSADPDRVPRPARRPVRRPDRRLGGRAHARRRHPARRRKVVTDFRAAARLDEREFERVFASGGGPPATLGRDAEGRLMVPAVTLWALVPGIRSQVPDGAPAPDRVPRRQLRRARLRLTAPPAAAPAAPASAPGSADRVRPARPPLPVDPRRRRRRRRGDRRGRDGRGRRPPRAVDDAAPVHHRHGQRSRGRARDAGRKPGKPIPGGSVRRR